MTEECGFDKAWIGPCVNLKPCDEHADIKCVSCGAAATRECPETGQFVCGFPLCGDCEHTVFPDGTNGGIGFHAQEPPADLKSHCRKDTQRYKPWYAQPAKALSLNLDDSGQNFAGVATVRAALFDVFDSDDFYAADLWEGDFLAWRVSEEEASVNRGSFVDAVIARIAELQAPPHEGAKLENLCDMHKRRVLPAPTNTVCGMCQRRVGR